MKNFDENKENMGFDHSQESQPVQAEKEQTLGPISFDDQKGLQEGQRGN